MPRKQQKILLRFRDGMVGSLEPLNAEDEALVDKLMEGVAVAKSISYCG